MGKKPVHAWMGLGLVAALLTGCESHRSHVSERSSVPLGGFSQLQKNDSSQPTAANHPANTSPSPDAGPIVSNAPAATRPPGNGMLPATTSNSLQPPSSASVSSDLPAHPYQSPTVGFQSAPDSNSPATVSKSSNAPPGDSPSMDRAPQPLSYQAPMDSKTPDLNGPPSSSGGDTHFSTTARSAASLTQTMPVPTPLDSIPNPSDEISPPLPPRTN